MQKIDRALIEQREQELAKARADLQEAFVGIVDVIDELIDGIRVWYLMPEVLSRPRFTAAGAQRAVALQLHRPTAGARLRPSWSSRCDRCRQPA